MRARRKAHARKDNTMNDNDSKGILATVEAMLEGREYSMWSAPLAGWLYWSKYAVRGEWY